MTQVHICHLGFSVVPPRHKIIIKVISGFLPWMLDLYLGEVECSSCTSLLPGSSILCVLPLIDYGTSALDKRLWKCLCACEWGARGGGWEGACVGVCLWLSYILRVPDCVVLLL